jgi:hypothetical protein
MRPMRTGERPRTEAYLQELTVELAALPWGEREEIVREARSHILERLSRHEGDLDVILQDMGPPARYAASFLEGRDPDAPTAPASGTPLQRTVLMAARLVGAALNGGAGLLVLIALYKLAWPGRMGVWREPPTVPGKDLHLEFGFGVDIVPAGREILGYWLVPLALAAAAALAGAAWLLTHPARGLRR